MKWAVECTNSISVLFRLDYLTADYQLFYFIYLTFITFLALSISICPKRLSTL